MPANKSRTRRRPAPKSGSGPARSGQARLILLGAVVVSAAILAAWFPGRALLAQRSNLAGATAQLHQLRSDDAALTQERKNLSASSEIARIAREQYQLVNPGQQAYEVLPPAQTSGTSPGAPTSQAPPAASATLGSANTSTAPNHGPHGKANNAAQPSLLSRMVHALEFWR